MRFIQLIAASKLDEAKKELFSHLSSIVKDRLSEAKRYVAADNYEEVLELDEAIKHYETLHPQSPPIPPPIYTETPSDTSTSLPEMRLTAPWVVGTDDTAEGR